MSRRDDDLAYGDNYTEDRAGSGSHNADRGIVGDTFKFLKNKYHQSQQPHQSQQSYGYTEQSNTTGGQQYTSDQAGHDPTSGTQSPYPGRPPFQPPQRKPDPVSSVLNTLHGVVHGVGAELAGRLSSHNEPPPTSHLGAQSRPSSSQGAYGSAGASSNRYNSFAGQKNGNDVKWYVDGCGYMYAVSKALEGAKESIWILDWWLSPELYLRRPPMKNEQYRIDRMLQAAAQRGVRVNIIVYKEVTQALTLSSSHTKHALEDLHPNIAVFRHPDHLPDAQTMQSNLVSSVQNLKLDAATASRLGAGALKSLYGMADDVILYWAHHEKLCLVDGKIAFMGGLDLCYGRWDTNQHPIADAHPHDVNAIVFPGQDYNNARMMDFQDVVHWQNNKLDRKTSSRMGWSDISVSLHGPVVQDLRRHFVDRWNFILDEKYTVRKDVRYTRLSLLGTVGGKLTGSQGSQFANSDEQENTRPHPFPGYGSQPQFPPPPAAGGATDSSHMTYQQSTSRPYFPQPHLESRAPQPHQPGTYTTPQQAPYYPPPPPRPPPSFQYGSGPQGSYTPYDRPSHGGDRYSAELEGTVPQTTPYNPQQPWHTGPGQETRGFEGERTLDQSDESERGIGGRFSRYGDGGHQLKDEVKGIGKMLYGHAEHHLQHAQAKYMSRPSSSGGPMANSLGDVPCQIVRSCTKWSHGTPTEHSIQDAYIDVIQRSQHFVYIENQFFITATGDAQKPVKNQVGKAIVERIVRAARAGQPYKVIVLMPSVPAFAGDLRDDAALGTRAIMEFQYNSINRGGHSIMEMITKEGINPTHYIRFYNLRNYDRINASGVMQQAEDRSGVGYEEASSQHDIAVGAGYGGQGDGIRSSILDPSSQYQQYQKAARQLSPSGVTGSGRWDTVSECYMLGGEDIRNVPWDNRGDLSEIDAFVSEELYIHSKVLIADDRVVICGSANLNDRSQLGTHDSEIAIIIEDPTPVASTMAGRPWQATRFAASLRRQLFRKHLGLLRPQDMQRPDENFEPVGVPNRYDWDSPEDRVVADPLSDTFQGLWDSRARTNTEIFRKVFHAVPDDTVRNWNEYKEFYEYYFDAENAKGNQKENQQKPARYMWGHVVKDNFSAGQAGVKEVKDLLSRVKGTLVEMPLMFLIEEDIAKEGTTLNALTEEVYT